MYKHIRPSKSSKAVVAATLVPMEDIELRSEIIDHLTDTTSTIMATCYNILSELPDKKDPSHGVDGKYLTALNFNKELVELLAKYKPHHDCGCGTTKE